MSEAIPAPASSFEAAWLGNQGSEPSFVADPRFVSTATGVGHSPPCAAPVAPDSAHVEREAAFDEGRLQGRAETLAEAKLENAERRKLGVALRRFDDEMTDRLGRQLAETVAVLCEGTLAPLALDRARLAERCREAAVLLGEDLSGCTLRLHPSDIPRIDDGGTDGWDIASDDTLEPGSIRLVGRDGEIASGPQEWRRSLAEALGIGPGPS